MTEYYAQRPNMYTGTANVSIPLYTISFDGWDLPLSVSYNATGIRTNEDASEVGLGWSLNATGVISRTIRGGDDFYLGGLSGYKVGFPFNTKPLNSDTTLGFDYLSQTVPTPGGYYDYLAKSRPDTEPDLFNYNFFGFSGSFVLTQKVTTGTIKVVKLTEDATVIKFDEDAKTFTIITPSGFRGQFNVFERSSTLSSSANVLNRKDCCSLNNFDITDFVNNSGKHRVITSWYLSTIVSPRGEAINFTYDLNPDGSSSYVSKTISFPEWESISSIESCLITVHEHVYIKKIESPDVRLTFTKETRDDVAKNDLFTPGTFPSGYNPQRYTSIQITAVDPTSDFNRLVQFKQSYFNLQYFNEYAVDPLEPEWLRGRLDRLMIDDQEYRFQYENGSKGIPNKLTTGVDHFGFYNGLDNNARLLPPEHVTMAGSCNMDQNLHRDYQQLWERRVDFDAGKAGLLKKIVYPTRGYTLFEYEAHRYLPRAEGNFTEIAGEKYAGGARIKSITDYDFDSIKLKSKTYKYVVNPPENASHPADLSTTGKLMTELYNRYIWPIGSTSSCRFLFQTNAGIPGHNSAEGKVIGYSEVHEIVEGKTDRYLNNYYFENVPNKVIKFNGLAEGNPNLNGQVKEIRYYDGNGQIVQRTSNQDYEHNLDDVIGLHYVPNNSTYITYWAHYKLKRTFHRPYTVVTTTAFGNPSGIVETNGVITSLGTNSSTSTTTVEYSNYFLLKSESFINSDGTLIKTEYKRPKDYSGSNTALDWMRDDSHNLIEPVIEEIQYSNGTPISANAKLFELDNGRINLRHTYRYDQGMGAFTPSSDGVTFLPASYRKEATYSKYDPTTGRLLEFQGADGLIRSYLWENRLLRISAVNLGYDQLLSAYNFSTDEASLRADPLVKSSEITSYQQKSLIGVTRITYPSGQKTDYAFDNFARLRVIKDNEGNIIDHFEQKYKQLPMSRVLSVAPSLSFGTFYSCEAMPVKILTLKNDGDDNLRITAIQTPAGFSTNWFRGTISPGASVDVTISFNGTGGGEYSGNIVIISDKTAPMNSSDIPGPTTNFNVAVSAYYYATGTNRVLELSTNALTVTTNFDPQLVEIRNPQPGNGCLTISSITPGNEEWDIAYDGQLPFTIVPGKPKYLRIRRLKSTAQTFEVTIGSNKTSGNNKLVLSK